LTSPEHLARKAEGRPINPEDTALTLPADQPTAQGGRGPVGGPKSGRSARHSPGRFQHGAGRFGHCRAVQQVLSMPVTPLWAVVEQLLLDRSQPP
jgi:hypothetical protein